MRVKPIILSICACMLLVSAAGYGQERNLWAPVYPGAVRCEYSSGENVSVFFSRDSFDKIEAFYAADKGIKPRKSESNGARSALFIYSKSVYGDAGSIDGVSINYDHAYSRAAETVFNRLEQLILNGALDRQEFDEIHRRYERMGLYFVRSDQRDKRGYYTLMDKIILLQYEQQIEDYIQEGESWEENEEDLMIRFNTLVAQGKMQEAAELMQKASAQSIEAGQRPTSRRVVELWKECLSEMAAAAYPVRLEIGRKR
ncbi:MAG: hypothetical protein R6V86_13045 [Spirochaetia bacterium]